MKTNLKTFPSIPIDSRCPDGWKVIKWHRDLEAELLAEYKRAEVYSDNPMIAIKEILGE